MTSPRSGTFDEPGTSGNFDISKGSGAASGDLAICSFSTEDSATVTCSSRATGFLRVGGGTEADPVVIDTTGADMRGFVYAKVLDGTEGSVFNFQLSTSVWVSWAQFVTLGAAGLIVSTFGRTAALNGGTGAATVSAITLTAGQLAYAVGATYESGAFNSVTTWTEPSGSTRMSVYKATTDATNRAFDNAVSGTRWWSFTMIIDAAGGGTPATIGGAWGVKGN